MPAGWVAAAIGAACGMKHFAVAITAVVLAMDILLVLGASERFLFGPKPNDDSPEA